MLYVVYAILAVGRKYEWPDFMSNGMPHSQRHARDGHPSGALAQTATQMGSRVRGSDECVDTRVMPARGHPSGALAQTATQMGSRVRGSDGVYLASAAGGKFSALTHRRICDRLAFASRRSTVDDPICSTILVARSPSHFIPPTAHAALLVGLRRLWNSSLIESLANVFDDDGCTFRPSSFFLFFL